MKLKLIAAACVLSISEGVFAASYQAELNANATSYDSNDDFNTKFYDFSGRYYFNAVKTDNLPLAEAAYLGKNSNVFAGATLFPKQNGSPRGEIYRLGAEFYIPEDFFYVSAGAWHSTSGNNDDDDWFATVGITPIDGLLVTTTYNHQYDYKANLHAKYVTDIGAGQFINLEAGLEDTESGTYSEIGGDFYIDNTFSVGGLVTHQDSNNTYTIRTRKFFTDSFSGNLSYTDTDWGNEYTVGVSVRF